MIQAITSQTGAGQCQPTSRNAGKADFAAVLSACGSGAASTAQAASAGDTSSSASGGMSIAQIRDLTDQMAIAGKLTIKQQMALIGAGLMDPNPSDPSYQPVTDIPVGYSRADGGSYDFLSMMDNAASAAALSGLKDTADIYRGIAQAFQDYVSSPRTSAEG